MQDTYYMGAYWGNRQESVEECAQRVIDFLRKLADIDEAFTRWFQLGRSRAEALSREVALDKDVICRLLEQGRSRRYRERTAIENLGFMVGLWNGGPDGETVGLNYHCGSYASTAITWIPNSCVVNLPVQGVVSQRITNFEKVAGVVRAAAESFDPDWAVLNSHQYRELGLEQPPGVPLVGWITYLNSRYGQLPRMPRPVRTARIDKKGTLIVATEERFAAENPEHVRTADGIAKTLRDAGVLRRID